jgi:hypothetical protein
MNRQKGAFTAKITTKINLQSQGWEEINWFSSNSRQNSAVGSCSHNNEISSLIKGNGKGKVVPLLNQAPRNKGKTSEFRPGTCHEG